MTDIVERLRKEDDELKRQTAFTDLGYKITIFEDAADEIERLREELDTWESVFPDIAPDRVQPDRSLLEAEIERLRKENERLSTTPSGAHHLSMDVLMSEAAKVAQLRDEIELLRKSLGDLVMLERIKTPDMSRKPHRYAMMQNGRVLAETLDKARAVLDATASPTSRSQER